MPGVSFPSLLWRACSLVPNAPVQPIQGRCPRPRTAVGCDEKLHTREGGRGKGPYLLFIIFQYDPTNTATQRQLLKWTAYAPQATYDLLLC